MLCCRWRLWPTDSTHLVWRENPDSWARLQGILRSILRKSWHTKTSVRNWNWQIQAHAPMETKRCFLAAVLEKRFLICHLFQSSPCLRKNPLVGNRCRFELEAVWWWWKVVLSMRRSAAQHRIRASPFYKSIGRKTTDRMCHLPIPPLVENQRYSPACARCFSQKRERLPTNFHRPFRVATCARSTHPWTWNNCRCQTRWGHQWFPAQSDVCSQPPNPRWRSIFQTENTTTSIPPTHDISRCTSLQNTARRHYWAKDPSNSRAWWCCQTTDWLRLAPLRRPRGIEILGALDNRRCSCPKGALHCFDPPILERDNPAPPLGCSSRRDKNSPFSLPKIASCRATTPPWLSPPFFRLDNRNCWWLFCRIAAAHSCIRPPRWRPNNSEQRFRFYSETCTSRHDLFSPRVFHCWSPTTVLEPSHTAPWCECLRVLRCRETNTCCHRVRHCSRFGVVCWAWCLWVLKSASLFQNFH